MLRPIVIPLGEALAFLAAMILAVVGMAIWTVQGFLGRTPAPGRHRTAADLAAAEAAEEPVAPPVAEPIVVHPRVMPRDALDPAMPLSDVEALMDSLREATVQIEPMPRRIPGAALAASLADYDTAELMAVA